MTDEGLVRLYQRLPVTAADRWWVELAAASPDGRVLYVGCGTGRLALPIARACDELVACDVDAQMLEAFEARLEDAPQVRAEVRLLEVAAQDLDLGERFGLVVLPSSLLNGIADPAARAAVVRAAASHCRADGRVVLQVLNPYWMAQRFELAEGVLEGADEDVTVRVRIEQADFDVWEQRQRARLVYVFPDGEELVDEVDAVALYPRELRALAYQCGLSIVDQRGADPRHDAEVTLDGGTWHLVCVPGPAEG